MKTAYLFCLLSVFALFSCKTASVQEFDDLVNFRKDGVCHLKRGDFYPKQTITVPSGTTIIGHGTKIRFDEASPFPIFRASQISGTNLQNIEFYGEKLDEQTDKRTLEKYNYWFVMEMHNSSEITLDHCRFTNSYGTAVHLSDCSQVAFKNSAFSNIGVSTTGDGLYSYDGIIIGARENTEKITISRCSFKNIGTNFSQGVPSWPNDGDGVHIQGQGTINDVEITENSFHKCASRGVKVQSGFNIEITDNHFSDCWTAVNIAMAKDVDGVNISYNTLNNCRLSFGTDCLANEKRTAYNINITQNVVDSCLHFFRTSGQSSVQNASISGNKIGQIGTYFFTGRLINTRIENNSITQYATENDPVDNMAIYISPESDRLSIRNNVFGKPTFAKKEIVNQSQNNISIGENQFIPIEQQ